MFFLIWRDSGVEGGYKFTKIETVDGKPSQDVTIMNGMKTVDVLHISTDSITEFFNKAAEVGVPVCAEVIGNSLKGVAA